MGRESDSSSRSLPAPYVTPTFEVQEGNVKARFLEPIDSTDVDHGQGRAAPGPETRGPERLGDRQLGDVDPDHQLGLATGRHCRGDHGERLGGRAWVLLPGRSRGAPVRLRRRGARVPRVPRAAGRGQGGGQQRELRRERRRVGVVATRHAGRLHEGRRVRRARRRPPGVPGRQHAREFRPAASPGVPFLPFSQKRNEDDAEYPKQLSLSDSGDPAQNGPRAVLRLPSTPSFPRLEKKKKEPGAVEKKNAPLA